MKISLVIPAYNEESYIRECLLSIEKYRTNDLLEVIVVDNGSTDTTSLLARQFSFVTVIFEPKKGSNNARQRGLMYAKGDLVAFLDADSCITKEWMQTAVDKFVCNRKLVALSGPCIFYNLNNFHSILVWVYFNIFAIPLSKITNSVILGGNLVMEKNAIIGIGGFDTTIAFYGDDTNIARRLKKIGKVLFERKLFIYTSSRRLRKEGVMRAGFIYTINHFSEKFLHTQVTKKYVDIR